MRKRRMVWFAVLWILFGAAAVHAGMIDMPKTGQTAKYFTGDDGNIQAGVQWPNPRFVSGTGTETDCIIDKLTGLMWPKDGDIGGAPKKWQEAIDFANKFELCGYNDWRLPNVNEFESLLNAGKSTVAAWLNTRGFAGVKEKNYWSSTNGAHNADYAWYIGMDNNNVDDYRKSDANYVWPVRSGQSGSSDPSITSNIWKTGQTQSMQPGDDGDHKMGVEWPVPRFKDPGDGTVIDLLTGLVWTKSANAPGPPVCSTGSKMTWKDALEYIACLNENNYLGYKDWTLPNRKQLFSLIDRSRYKPALPFGNPFTDVKLKNYWSSTTDPQNADQAFYISMDKGNIDDYRKTDTNYVWPVRAAQQMRE